MIETFKSAFLSKYPKCGSVLTFYEKANGMPIEWDNVTKPRLQKFVSAMAESIAPNSVRQYCAKVKSVMNLYADEVDLPKGFDKILSIKSQVSQNVYLTDLEIKAIMGYSPKDINERIVKNQFLLGGLTCARHSGLSILGD